MIPIAVLLDCHLFSFLATLSNIEFHIGVHIIYSLPTSRKQSTGNFLLKFLFFYVLAVPIPPSASTCSPILFFFVLFFNISIRFVLFFRSIVPSGRISKQPQATAKRQQPRTRGTIFRAVFFYLYFSMIT